MPTFWIHIDTAETGTTAYDKLTVQVTSGTTNTTLATCSNANAWAGYSHALGSRKNISTRRFCARPLSVLLSAIGSRSPRPSIEMRDGETPRSAR